MNRKKAFFSGYIIIWVLLIIYLRFSNQIISLGIPDEQLMKKVDIDEYTSTTIPIFYLEEPLEHIGGMYEYSYCAGWAFCETDFENSDKRISIVLKNVDNNLAFACEIIPYLRKDVYDTFKNIRNIYNGMVAINYKYSTLNLPNGIYEMLIYVKENEYDYGITSTDYYYKKTSTNFVRVDKEGNELVLSENGEILANEVVVSVENISEQGKWNIDNITKAEESLTISGWASYSSETNNNQEIYIAVNYIDGSVKYYTTQSVSRSDVATYFNDESYMKCGFKTTISDENINEVYSISLVAKVDEKYYPIVWDGKILDEQNIQEYLKTEKFDSVEVTLSQEEEEGIAFIDYASLDKGVITVRGWASYSDETNEEQKIYLGLISPDGSTVYYETENHERKDVAEKMGESYMGCGYNTEIRPDVLEDEYTISIVIQVGNNFYPINIRNSRVINCSVGE